MMMLGRWLLCVVLLSVTWHAPAHAGCPSPAIVPNAFIAQTAGGDNSNPSGVSNKPPASGFGRSTVYMANVDRVYMSPVDGQYVGYENSSWWYDIDACQWTRKRPDPTGAHGAPIPSDINNIHDYNGPAWGDNQQIGYNPDTGTVWRWGGNAGDNNNPNSRIDASWFGHINTNTTNAGVYIYGPTTNTWAMPATTGYALNLGGSSASRYLSAGVGWDPNIHKFLQVLGSSANGFDIRDSYVVEIDPSTSLGGTYSRFNFTPSFSGQPVNDAVNGPHGRGNISYQFVYNSRAKKWLLFGGVEDSSGYPAFYNDTWEYDAVTRRWTNLAPIGSPPPRAWGLMWYDSVNDVTLITAGLTTGQAPENSTWVYNRNFNTWTNTGITFNRGATGGAGNNSGGVIFDPTRNVAIITPSDGSSSPPDVYAFRYAIPRAPMATRTWYGIKPTTSGTWNWPEKHTTATYMPSASPLSSNGKVYIGGGDTDNHSIPDGFGGDGGGISYQQNLYSIDLYAKFANPANLTAGTALEHGWCVTGSNVMPKHMDYYGITADPRRRVLWFVPGLQETSSDVTGQYNCPGESRFWGDDANYLHGHLLTFDPTTKLFTDVSTNNDIQFPVTGANNVWPWLTHYDAVTDKLLRIKDGASTNNRLGKASGLSGTISWSNTEIGGPGEFKRAHWAWDPQRREAYIAERETSGHLFRLAVDTGTLTDLGLLPGTPLWPSDRVPADKNYTAFDWNARLLVYIEREDSGTVVWTYDPDTRIWTNISTLPRQSLDGGPLGGAIPSGTAATFDPDNNMVLIYGFYTSAQPNGYNYWAIRLSEMGTATLGTALQAAVLPSSRSVQVGTSATAFATLINTSRVAAAACGISPQTSIPALFQYQTTDPSTNGVTGTPNTPVSIPAGQAQTYVFAFAPIGSVSSTDVRLSFDCANTDPAPVTSGVNTLLLSASASPVPDIVAMAASGNPGIVDIPGVAGTGVFAVATVNVGAGSSITVSADTGDVTLPLITSLCQTHPTTGQCISAIGATVSTQIQAGETQTYGIFVTGTGPVAFDPTNNRVFVRFKDAGNVTRGSTSLAVRTQ